MSPTWETLQVDRDAGVVTIVLNRPERRNALNDLLLHELNTVLTEIQETEADRAVLLTGAGPGFCSGADLDAIDGAGRHPLDQMRKGSNVALTLHRLTKPVLAKVRGAAVGAGWNLALACDLVLASDNARFGQVFVRRGLSLDFGGSWSLPRLIGLHRAKELALFGDMLSAQEAADLGLVNRVVPDSDLDDVASAWMSRLAAGPPHSMGLIKRQLNDSMSLTMAQSLDAEAAAQLVNFATTDSGEAFRAFREKRPPVFTGRSGLTT
jgi:2-(1,2-epoxy-1,2-dihydrophenyl)acetyl-CoA isomerase